MRVFWSLLFLVHLAIPARSAGEQVYVIAESLSTSSEARRIAQQQRWIIAPLRQSSHALVVVRSSMQYPLIGIYKSVSDIQQDASLQLNISGPNFVVYLFALDDNLRPTELKRIVYPARD